MRKAPFIMMNNTPFDPDNESAYLEWRELKLQQLPASLEQLIVEVKHLGQPSPAEVNAMVAEVVQQTKSVVYTDLPAQSQPRLPASRAASPPPAPWPRARRPS